MCLVELPGCGGGEADGAGPEILLRIVALQPGADGVALAHVEHVALAVRARPQQQVQAGLCQLGPGLDLRQQRTREHQRLADPVGLIDDAQAVGVAAGDEDAEGKGTVRTQNNTFRQIALVRYSYTKQQNLFH